MADWGALLGGGLGALFSGLAINENLGNIEDDRQRVSETIYGSRNPDFGPNGLMGTVDSAATFVPSTVTSRTGNTSYNNGQLGFNLSQGQQAQADQLATQSMDFYNRAAMDPTARENAVYDRIRAVQAPEEQRQYDQMNANLFGSGRGGMFSSAYGGTPEQMAFGKAQAEARNQAMVSAMSQAQQEMMNYGRMGQATQAAQYLPSDQLRADFGALSALDQMRMQSGSQRAGLLGQMGLGGLTTDVNYSNVYGGLLGELAKAAGSAGTGLGDFIGSLI